MMYKYECTYNVSSYLHNLHTHINSQVEYDFVLQDDLPLDLNSVHRGFLTKLTEDEGWVVRRLVDRSRDHPAGELDKGRPRFEGVSCLRGKKLDKGVLWLCFPMFVFVRCLVVFLFISLHHLFQKYGENWTSSHLLSFLFEGEKNHFNFFWFFQDW